MRALVVIAALLASRAAQAQPGLDILAPPGLTQPIAPPAIDDDKDPGTATLLAVAGSVAPALLVGLAVHGSTGGDGAGIAGLAILTFGLLPSAGHWYAGRFLTPGMITRGAGLTLVGGSLLLLYLSEGTNGTDGVWAGAITTGVGILIDIATAAGEAEHYNASHHPLKPVAMTFHSGGYGVGLGGSF